MKKILVIEDNTDVRENIEEILSLSDYEVVTAGNGVEGIEQAISTKPDLILCDVMMPKLDGFGVLRILSQKPETNLIPFIFLTAKAEKEDFRTGMSLGADDYVTKPFEPRDLLDVIEIRLKKSDQQNQKTKQKVKTLIDTKKGLEDLELLAKKGELFSYHKKDILFKEGEIPRKLFYILSGKVKTYRTNDFGKELITGIFKEGEFIGFNALLGEERYSESAAVLEYAQVSFISKEAFYELLHTNSDFSTLFIKMLSANIREKESRLVDLAYSSIRKRIANALLVFHQKYHSTNNKIDVLRDDLASLAGTTKESASRTLTDFKTEKLIDIDRQGMITIINKQQLAQMQN